MKIDKTWIIGLGLTLPLAGCPGDDGPSTTAANDSTSAGMTDTTADTDPTAADSTAATAVTETATDSVDSTGEPPGECPGSGVGTADVGADCSANADCASGVCTIFTDVPLNDDAVCAETPANCGTRFTGTIFDFTTGEALSGANVVVAAALQAATNPTGAMALVEATSGGDGRIDETSPDALMAPIGIVALTSSGGYYLTATGLAAPVDGSSYNVGSSIHDIWAVPETDLQDWSDELSMDPAILPESLPLGDAGGVVGFVRDTAGVPVGGAEVSSTNDGSGAIIRYLNDDGTFGVDRTSDLGIFVIIEPALAEVFEVSVAGAVVGGGTAGSADGAIFTMIVNAQ